MVWALSTIYGSPVADTLTFKGGTSLSKVYQVAALRGQCRAIRTGTDELFPRGRQCRIGYLQFLSLGGDHFLAGQSRRVQPIVTPRLGLRMSLPCLGFAQGRFGALEHGVLGAHTLIEIDRVHLAEDLPGLHPVAHVNVQPLHTPCNRRADSMNYSRQAFQAMA